MFMQKVVNPKIIFVGFIAIFSSASFAGQNCELKLPPVQAGVNSNHGKFFFIFPRTIDENYSGCQTMWDERGKKWWILEFELGLPKSLTINEPSKPPTKAKCIYEDSALIAGASDACVSYEVIKKGIPSIEKGMEPKIPAKRDLRLSSQKNK